MNNEISQAIHNTLGNIEHQFSMISSDIMNTIYEYSRPSTVYKPTISKDGDLWCALYGEDLQSGIAGFGKSPSLAMVDFDK